MILEIMFVTIFIETIIIFITVLELVNRDAGRITDCLFGIFYKLFEGKFFLEMTVIEDENWV